MCEHPFARPVHRRFQPLMQLIHTRHRRFYDTMIESKRGFSIGPKFIREGSRFQPLSFAVFPMPGVDEEPCWSVRNLRCAVWRRMGFHFLGGKRTKLPFLQYNSLWKERWLLPSAVTNYFYLGFQPKNCWWHNFDYGEQAGVRPKEKPSYLTNFFGHQLSSLTKIL